MRRLQSRSVERIDIDASAHGLVLPAPAEEEPPMLTLTSREYALSARIQLERAAAILASLGQWDDAAAMARVHDELCRTIDRVWGRGERTTRKGAVVL
jgi:hypothetical protein